MQNAASDANMNVLNEGLHYLKENAKSIAVESEKLTEAIK